MFMYVLCTYKYYAPLPPPRKCTDKAGHLTCFDMPYYITHHSSFAKIKLLYHQYLARGLSYQSSKLLAENFTVHSNKVSQKICASKSFLTICSYGIYITILITFYNLCAITYLKFHDNSLDATFITESNWVYILTW